MKCMRAVVIWAALVPALFALGCAATEEKKDEATGTVTVSGTITYTGWSSGDFTIYVFVGPPGDSDPIHTGSVAGGTSVSYSASVAESSGAISVAAVNDLDGSGGPPGAGEGCGVGEATVGTSNVTVNITVTIGGCEGGNGGGGATQLTVDAAATAGTVLNSGSAAYYFSGSNGTNYTVTLTSAQLSTPPGNADLDVCSTSSCGWGDGTGPNGGQSHSSGTTTETVTFTASASQSYYVNVYGVEDTAYTIQVTSSGGGGGATELFVNAPATAGTVLNGSGALYAFAGTSGTAYTVTLTSASLLNQGTPGDADLDVCSISSCGWGDGTPIGGTSHTSGEATETVTFTALPTQTYYVNIWGVSDTSYTIQVTSGGGGSAADLTVTIDSVTNTSSSLADVTFTVTNNGGTAAGPFDVMVWANRTVPPDYSSAQSGAFTAVTSLADGASQQFTQTGVGGTWLSSTGYTAYVLVDFFQDVTESDDTNNVATLPWVAE